ncbi:reverse transcriptase domain-containing protein, partial [Streptomyces lunaelactis]|uniref:reverse transcriptase domain-containing protein n=1 Tax=Streptomyces lunaelactis TaxID=1535768 RepID=UPI0028155D40
MSAVIALSLSYAGVMGAGIEVLIVDWPRVEAAAPGDRQELLIDAAYGEAYSDDLFEHGWAWAARPGRGWYALRSLKGTPARTWWIWAGSGAYAGHPFGLSDNSWAKDGSFRPLPVRERSIPKPGGSGKVRRLGIPTIADPVVQAALKLVLEPIFEADFKPVSYGFRPRRRAQDAIAEIHYCGTRGYRWVLDADIEACFDTIDHTALLDRVRHRVKDKCVLTLVKAFLKAGVLTELGENKETLTGTPQGGILSPLLANIALSVLDEHLHGPWELSGTMSTEGKRAYRRCKGRPTWRVVRYADDFVVLVHGTEADTAALREEIAGVLEPLGLRLSQTKTRIVHMSDGFDFLGFRIQWKRKGGTNKWHVYTFIADRPIRSLKAKIRALTGRTSQQDLATVLIRLTQRALSPFLVVASSGLGEGALAGEAPEAAAGDVHVWVVGGQV